MLIFNIFWNNKKAMKKSGINNIRTIVVLDSVNPDDQRIINQHNPKVRRSLLSIIKSGGYACVPAMENFGNFYHPYAIFNMSLDLAKKICGKQQQSSFVFSVLNENGMIHSEYYSKQDPTLPYNKQANDYIKNDECDTWEDTSYSEGNFTVIGKEFKYGIPFKTLYAVNDAICENLKRMVSVDSISEYRIIRGCKRQ